ncbi:sulfite exporter TauE/SafE family protein [Streptomyces pluripotens]|uniref:Probable membrane transporter protein n=1 Tax=Streptomyces pluripotens TaxID=1355015 RepID=A0A221NYY6_9ACTN|nr:MULTISPECIES: sulfite exporter TauE/SafE family protein [Streptomyces]ARP70943.1 integral membrane family protein [Streptomyces pluripotens]ASN25197.1 sulfite exporter TauE/SafE family protein [Streptomyces pluripotens]KIE27644.1 integral membrane family protein [Streptomyces sp. MUSC 125]MCH0559730.1 sulfite exporter TauE/SafE family protein [Streptomyces sp. MUM 16J]
MSAVILALLAGAVIGLALGGLGGGGSVLAVPALIYLLGFTPVAATTASLVIVTVTSATALSAHARDGNVRWRAGLLFAAAGIGPAMLGSALAGQLPAAWLTVAFALLAGAASIRMLRPRPTAGPAAPVRPGRAAAAGAGLGAVTGVLGVGGGFLAVPALVNVLGMRIREAVGTSLLVITVNSVAALAMRAGTADGLNWALIGPFAGAAILGAWDGKRLSAKLSGQTLQRVFALVLLAVAGFMLVDTVA